MIRLENVTKRYKTGAGINTILNNVSLTFPKGHSVGIAFSVSLACDFDYYLVDEALETGDARYREKFRRAFEERRENASVVLVSHNEQTIRRNCDMAAILHDGRIDMYDDLKEAMHSYKLLQTNAA